MASRVRTISRADLARRLQTSAAAVTMALRGDANLTIERMVRMARALDATVHIRVAPAAAGDRSTADAEP